MRNSKLISLMKTLSPKEIKAFGEFVHSPFFNKLKFVTMLYDELKNYYPEFSSDDVSKESIFVRLYPGEKYHDGKIRNLGSDLLKLLMQYLSIKSFQNDGAEVSKHLLKEMRERRQDFLFEKEFDKITNTMGNTAELDENYFEKLLFLDKEYLRFLDERKHDVKEVDRQQQKVADMLIRFFAVSALKIYTFMLNQNLTLYSHEYKLSFIEQLREHIKTNIKEYEKDYYIIVYYHILELLINKDEGSYYRLKDVMNKYFEGLSDSSRKNTYTIMSNYCHLQIYNGNMKYEREVFELDKETLAYNIYDEEYLHHNRFRNILIHAANLKELGWAEKFISEYRPRLLKEYRESSANWGYAYINFKKNEYDKSLKHLLRVQTEDLSFKLYIRSLQMMIYYETGQTESLFSMFDSFRHLIKKAKQISEVFRDFFTNFVKFTEKLVRIREEVNSGDLHYLEKQITETTYIANKQWLLEKIHEIKTFR